jgi:hypothetical protein|tara:strand:+ start:515 stop:1210 length:696 start_codon:yes stop_codon:yes gene_type:complete
MRHLIRKIIKEQADSPDNKGGSGTYQDPIVNNDSGNVPVNSYEAVTSLQTDTSKYSVKPVTKRAFFKAVDLLVKMKDKSWFESNTILDEPPHYRRQEMQQTLKILGINNTGIEDKVFWAAVDNMTGIEDGAISNYNQLTLRAFNSYQQPMQETVRVWKYISWSPEVNAFDKNDAEAEILYDEDGIFHSGEYSNTPGYDEEDHDWESEGSESNGELFIVSVEYPEELGTEIK